MESSGPQPNRLSHPTVRWRIHTRVESIEQRFSTNYIRGARGIVDGQEFILHQAEFTRIPIGWFVVFEGSHESLYLGDTKPNLSPGDLVTITIERRDVTQERRDVTQERRTPP